MARPRSVRIGLVPLNANRLHADKRICEERTTSDPILSEGERDEPQDARWIGRRGGIAQVAELPALAAQPDVQLAGLVTRTPESAARNLARWPIARAYQTVEQMIDDARLDALFVLTPKRGHGPFVEVGLRAGLDVFCEKPLTTSLADSQRLVDLADRQERLLMVGFNRRFMEVYATAHGEFNPSEINFCIAQKHCPASEYRATLENAIHKVDLLYWFCGEAEEVTAHGIALDPYREEGIMAQIRFASGAIGSLAAVRFAGDWNERLDLFGSGISVSVIPPERVESTRGGETHIVEMRRRAMGWADANRTLGFGPEVSHFIRCVRERRQPLTNGHEAVRVQSLLETILARAGLPVQDANNL